MSKRVLITGASGLLGRCIHKEFAGDPTFTTTGQAFSRAGQQFKKADLTDKDQLKQLISDIKPDVIIHCAAERKPDIVEGQPEKTRKINIDATRNICQLAKEQQAFVVFISTDYVFDGTNPPYSTEDKPNPLNLYGKSKVEGEEIVMDASKGKVDDLSLIVDNMVLRIPLLYGEVEYLDESAVTTLFQKVKNTKEKCLMSAYERRYPTHCSDVAAVLKDLVSQRFKDPNLTGIFHWSDNQNMTKYDIAVTMAEAFNLPTSHIEADNRPSTGAKRPYNAHIDASRIEKLGICHRTPFAKGVKACLEKFMESS